MISFAKFAIIFEICKSVFLISLHSKACNSLVYRPLERFGLFLNNTPPCTNTTIYITTTYASSAHLKNLVHNNNFYTSESMKYQAVAKH